MKKIIVNFIGFDPKRIKRLGKYHAKRIYHLCLSVPFTALVSAGLIALTLNTLFEGLSRPAIIGISTLWFLLIAFIDRAIVVARSTDMASLRYIRVATIIAFIFIHAGPIDQEFFKGDIKTKMAADYQAKKDTITAKFVPMYAALNTQIEVLYAENAAIGQKITEGRNTVYREIHDGDGTTRGSGRGRIAREKEKLFQADKKEFDKAIALNVERIEALEAEVEELDAQKATEILALPQYADTGLMDRLIALHEVVFTRSEGEGSKLPLQLYYFAFLFVAAAIEALPLIAKITYKDSIDAYLQNADKHNSLKDDKVEVNLNRKKNDLRLLEAEEIVRYNIENDKIARGIDQKIKIARQKAKMEGEIEYAITVEAQLDAIISKDKEAKNKYSDEHYKLYYEKVIKPAFNAFLADEPIHMSEPKDATKKREE